MLLSFISYQLRREEQKAQEWTEALITLCTEQGFPQLLALGTMLRGWVLAEQGQGDEGIVQMQQGLTALRATGQEEGRTHWLAELATAHGKVGQTEEGLTLLAEALAFIDKTGERVWEARLYRLKGELILQSKVEGPKSQVADPRPLTPDPQAEACFLEAIDIARRQQAKSLELRAVMSLSQLWQ